MANPEINDSFRALNQYLKVAYQLGHSARLPFWGRPDVRIHNLDELAVESYGRIHNRGPRLKRDDYPIRTVLRSRELGDSERYFVVVFQASDEMYGEKGKDADDLGLIAQQVYAPLKDIHY